jgi:hypothetical protein
MTTSLKFFVSLFLIIICLVSCKKDDIVQQVIPSAPPPPHWPLAGREFIFDSLTWGLGYDYRWDMDEILVTAPYLPDIFYYNQLQKEISVRPDSSSIWIPAQTDFYYSPGANYYWYYFYQGDTLRVVTNPFDFQLIGKYVSVKVKFL